MAHASIPHSAPVRQPARRRPDPARVVQAYYHQVNTAGKRGAYRRTSELYNCSPDTVERIIHRHEARELEREQTPPELVYVPPPGGYPEPKAAPIMAQDGASPVARNAAGEPHLDDQPSGDVTSIDELETVERAANSPQINAAECRSDQPETAPDLAAGLAEDTPQHPTPYQSTNDLLTSSELGLVAPPIVVRQVIRVAVDQRPAGVVAWLNEHPGVRQQLIAVAVFLVLVALTWWG